MSTWGIGLGDVTPEIQASKDQLSGKDAEIAAAHARFLKQTAALEEVQATLNDTLHKLNSETARAIQLESTSNQCAKDLQNERVSLANVKAELTSAQLSVKSKDVETRELESILEKLSHTSDDNSTRMIQLEREKSALEIRVRELQQSSLPKSGTPSAIPVFSRPQRARSPSPTRVKVNALEQELADYRSSSASKEAELRAVTFKADKLQRELVKINNEKMATEKSLNFQLSQAQAAAQEAREELQFLQSQHDGGSREEELLERIEDDEKKIATLEAMVAESTDTRELSEKLARAEERIRSELEKSEAYDARNVELVSEKEEALDELAEAQSQVATLKCVIEKQTIAIEAAEARDRTLMHQITTMNDEIQDSARLQFEHDLTVRDSKEPYPRQSTPTPASEPDEQAVVYIERLLAATERLRGERDGLRRDLQFLETEHKFTADALEKRTSASAEEHDYAKLVLQMKEERAALRLQLQQVSASQSSQLAGRQEQIRRLGLAVAASAVVISHFRSSVDSAAELYPRANAHASASLKESELAQESTQVKLAEVELKLEKTLQSLHDVTSSRDILQTQLATEQSEHTRVIGNMNTKLSNTEGQLTEANQLLQSGQSERDSLLRQLNETTASQRSADESTLMDSDLRDRLQHTEAELANVARTLEQVETERSGLSLQATNLLTDLQKAQKELADAEARYSTLQFHKLSTMSGQESSRVLRAQIEELEGRVMRRTEQIGIHQHDIKRLETNLRLQEECVAEMTAELETATSQKEAMVEDCADAREARDAAIERMEALDIRMETLETRLEDRDNEAAVLVGILISARGQSKRSVNMLKTSLTRVNSYNRILKEKAIGQSQTALSNFAALQRENFEMERDLKQGMLALAISQSIGSQHRQATMSMRQHQDELQEQNTVLQNKIGVKTSENAAQQAELQALRGDISTLNADAAARKTHLNMVQQELSDARSNYQQVVDALTHSKTQVEERLSTAERLLADNDTDQELQQQTLRHTEEIADLQTQLDASSLAFDNVVAQQKAGEEAQQQTLAALEQSKTELQSRLSTMISNLDTSERATADLILQKEAQQAEIAHLQRSLESTSQETTALIQSRNELENTLQTIREELATNQENAEAGLAAKTAAFDTIQQELQEKIASLDSTLADERSNVERAELKLSDLKHQLETEIDARAAQEDSHLQKIFSLTERCDRAEQGQNQLEQDVLSLEHQLQDTAKSLTSFRQEQESLKAENNRLQVEYQRSIALGKTLESQVKESQHAIASVNEELHRERTKVSQAEAAGQTAMADLSFKALEHQREITALRREINTLRSKPNLDAIVAELEERNNEMEEVLKIKCAEIENNDDRVMEYLKEKKKLTAKVETLTRKVQNLQTKLVAKAIPITSAADVPPVPAIPSTTFSRPRTAKVDQSPPAENDSTPVTRIRSTSRVMSGPSSLPRPKTPERAKVSLPPVFKARTPERRASAAVDAAALPSSNGKKRRSPDDFDEVVPRQAFTAESLPDEGSLTPRAGRPNGSVYSTGFTPVRHLSRPTIPLPSPRQLVRASATPRPLALDVTNSPRAVSHSVAKTTAGRSWLGKIRAASTSATPRSGPP